MDKPRRSHPLRALPAGLAPRDDGAFRWPVDKTLAALYRTVRQTFGREPLDGTLKAMFVINALPER